MSLHRMFTEHPDSVGESYVDHLRAGGAFGLRMMLGGLACLVHALLPFLFQHTGSDCVADLHQRMVRRRREPQRAIGPARPTAGGTASRSAAR
jgi:hypothetical protein